MVALLTRKTRRRRPIAPDWVRLESEHDHVLVRCLQHDLRDSQRVAHLVQLLESLTCSGGGVVELDLRDVGRADTKLVAALVHAIRYSMQHRVALLIHLSRELRPLVEVCRLSEAFVM